MASDVETLVEFFPKYNPPIRARKHTCVGLGLELVKRLKALEKDFPGLSSSMALVSCDETVPDVTDYVASGAGPQAFLLETEKDHVMVCVHVKVDGRAGLLLADPGYHVARIVTVMADRCYPHTGWFTQCDEPHSRKDYNYSLNVLNANYVEWQERETRGQNVKEQTSLVYVARPYLTAINVTERRNLVYNFRSLLARDPKGHLIAGIYFPLKAKDQDFTIFFEGNSGKQRIKRKFNLFQDPEKIPDEVADEVILCSEQMSYQHCELLSIVKRLANIMADEDYVQEVLALNGLIGQLSAGD